VPAGAGESGWHPVPAKLPLGPPERLVTVLVVRDRPGLLAWDTGVAGLFDRPVPEWPGAGSPRAWAAALWLRPTGVLARSAGPVHGWDSECWRPTGPAVLHRDGQAASATRLAISLLATLADDPGRLREAESADGSRARVAA
jgi:hypothetical protein